MQMNWGNHLDDFGKWLTQRSKLMKKKLERSSPQGCISFQTDEKFDSNATVILIKNESIFVHDQNNDLDHYRDKRLND